MSGLSYVAGGALLVATTVGLLKVMIVPRRAWSIVASPSLAVMVRSFHAVARRMRQPDHADRFLGFLGPLYIVVLLATILGLYTVGFAALLAPQVDHAWGTAFRESGSSVFTLGFQSTPGTVPSIVDIVAAATGMVVIALFIAYLPTLYAAVKDRERFLKLLQSRIGAPPASGVNVLAEHYERGTQAMLVHLYREAERWAAGVSETHAKYPVLLHFRAPRAPLHWLSTMVGVADAAALQRVLLADTAPPETRAVIDAVELCLRELSHTAAAPVEHEATPPMDAAGAVNEAAARLRAAGADPIDDGTAADRFLVLRAQYAALGIGLASAVAAPERAPRPSGGRAS